MTDYDELRREAERVREDAARFRDWLCRSDSVRIFPGHKELQQALDLITRLLPALKDARRLDALESASKTHWVEVYSQPHAERIYRGQGVGLRNAIDAALKEASRGQ